MRHVRPGVSSRRDWRSDCVLCWHLSCREKLPAPVPSPERAATGSGSFRIADMPATSWAGAVCDGRPFHRRVSASLTTSQPPLSSGIRRPPIAEERRDDGMSARRRQPEGIVSRPSRRFLTAHDLPPGVHPATRMPPLLAHRCPSRTRRERTAICLENQRLPAGYD